MKIQTISLEDIVPAEYNPRIIFQSELEYLKNSIDEFGFVDPIIINLKNNKIIGGHQRYKILLADKDKYKELKLIQLGDIGWVFPNDELEIKSEDHEKALNIALNKISGEWDNKKLDNLLEELEMDGFDVNLTGFEKLIEESGESGALDDFLENDDFDFFNNVMTEVDDVDDLEDEELSISEAKTIIQLGDYKFEISTSAFNYWIRQIEKENNFDLTKTREDLRKRLKL